MYLISSGSYLPGEKITNQMLADVFGPSVNLMGDYFGVLSRHLVLNYQTGENDRNEFNSDISLKAAKIALSKGDINFKEIGLIISATNSPDYTLPQTSILIQEKLGIDTVIALDIRGGCAAPLQAMVITDAFIKSGLVKHALVVGSECFSTIYYPYLLKQKNNFLAKDLMNSLIFGDGATAILLSAEKLGTNPLKVEFTHSQSSFSTLTPGFIVSLGGSKVSHLGEAVSIGKMMKNFPKEIRQNLPEVIKEALLKIQKKTGVNKETFKYIVGPQANQRLISTINREFNSTNYFYNGDRVGNVPAAALILALDELLTQNELKPSEKILVLGVESPKWVYAYCMLSKE